MENVRSTPKDVFLHLFNVVTFYLSVIGFITLFIQYINALFPDALSYYFTAIANGVRWSSSVLFVAVPAFIFTSWLLARDLEKNPEKRDLKLRKWLIYFTLFISAITIIVDLMIFVYNFLDGELTIKFFLKVLVVLLVAGAVFGYYMWELKRQTIHSVVPKVLAIVLAVVVLGSIVGGFFIVGTPTKQRARKMDEKRVSDLQTIQIQVVDYWMKKKVLPTNLDALQDNISGFSVPEDPDLRTYEYILVEPLKFELCANFSTSDKDYPSRGKNTLAYDSMYSAFQQNWDHEAGRVCFSRSIDPDLYKTGVENSMLIK